MKVNRSTYIGAGIAVIIVIVIAILIRKIRSYTPDIDSQVNDLDTTNSTITYDQAVIISQNLLNAMNRYGTDEKSIIDNLTGLNADDIKLVIKAFGIKPYTGGVLATMWHQKKFLSADLNLIGWLNRELKGGDLDKVKQILETQGIKM